MVNLPIWGTPEQQLPRISLPDAQAGLGVRAVGKLGTPGAYPGLITPDILAQILGTSTTGFSLTDMAAFDAMVQAYGASLVRQRKMLTQPILNDGMNIANDDGQSFSTATGGQPPVDLATAAGLFMSGSTQQFNVADTGVRTPFTDALFQLAGTTNEGYMIGAMLGFRLLDLAAQGLPPSSTDRAFLSNHTGTSGRTITELSRSAAPVSPAIQNLFAGKLNVYQYQHDLAVAAGKTPAIVAVIHDQGQNDYSSDPTALPAAADWTPATGQYIDDTYTYAAQGIMGQALRPQWLVHQPGGAWTTDTPVKLGVANGVIQLGQQRPDVVVSQPSFNVPSHGGGTFGNHPTTNAYRWMGCKDAQVLWWILGLGRNWDFMRPLFIWWKGDTILVGVLPRVAPLQFVLPYNGLTRVAAGAYPNQGFDIADDNGPNPIANVGLFGAGTIVIQTARSGLGQVLVSNGSQQFALGKTFIADSDPWVAPLNWAFISGMDPAENDPAMVGKPYPMNNSLLAFSQYAIAV